MKYLLVFIQLFVGSAIFAQDATRVYVPGMKCSMEIEAGFQLATRFTGFENIALNANIFVSNLASSLERNLASVESDQMKKKGFILISKKEVSLKHGPASLFVLSHKNKDILIKKFFLIFGDSTKTIFIDAMAPDSNSVLCNQLERIIMSTIYDPNMEEDPFATLDFTMKLDTSIFKVAKNTIKNIIFTNGEKMNPAFLSFTVAVQTMKSKPEGKSSFALSKLKGLTGVDSVVTSTIDSVKIDGLDGFVMKTTTLGKSKMLSYNYQVLLFGKDENYYLMIGRSLHSMESSVKSFEPISKSFKLKQ